MSEPFRLFKWFCKLWVNGGVQFTLIFDEDTPPTIIILTLDAYCLLSRDFLFPAI